MIVAVIALIVALGGSAYAAKKIGSKQLKKNAVTTKKIKNGAVTAAKLANGAVKGAVAATGTAARSTTKGCDPTTTAFIDCGTVSLNLPSSGRVLLVADAGDDGSNQNTYAGVCRLTADGTTVGPSITFGQAAASAGATPVIGGPGFNSNGQEGAGLNGVTDVLKAGKHDFSLQCNQNLGSIEFEETGVSAVMLGAG